MAERSERAAGLKANANIGHRLRELRIERGLQQADVARRLGVSAAYVNLIEKGKRAVQLPLLWKTLELYGVALEPFMASLGEARLEDSLARLLDEPLLRSLDITSEDLHALSGEPKAASTIAALFNLYKNARGQLDQILVSLHRAERDAAEEKALRRELSRAPSSSPSTSARDAVEAERGASGSGRAPHEGAHHEGDPLASMRFDYSPFDEIVDFLEANDNYFPMLEELSERLRKDCGWGRRVLSDQLASALTEQYGVVVRTHPAAGRAGESSRDAGVIRRYESEAGVLSLSADMVEHRRKFQLAHTIGLRILDTAPRRLHDELSARFAPRHRETPKLIKIHLANYFAGALLLPYGDFFQEVTRTRYDVERLSDVFELPYETVAHRVVTLSDPRRKGLPMHFVRSDIAGNISKRYAGATGLRFPTGTGSCPRWAVHVAFLTPSAITKQYSIFPDGSTFFCFAKVVVQPQAGNVMRGTAYSIGLGTHADAAKHLAYAAELPGGDAAEIERLAVPVGVSCRFCERTDCAQRAAPSYKFAFAVDEYTKKDNVFSPLLGREAREGREGHGLVPLRRKGPSA
jgi:predicted transcriptional regulator/transcriptional regulator with XRE-family HTH domain